MTYFKVRYIAIFFLTWCLHSFSHATTKVGLSLWNEDKANNRVIISSFNKLAKKYGFVPLVMGSENSHDLQKKNIMKMASEGAAAILFQPIDANKAAEFLDLCLQKKIKMIALEADVQHPAIQDVVIPDYAKAGEIQAQKALKAKNYKGAFILLGGSQGHPLVESMFDGAINEIKKHRGASFEKYYLKNWSSDEAYNVFLNEPLKGNNKISAVLSATEDISDGAVKANDQRENGGSSIFISSFGASRGTINALIKGRQQLIIFADFDKLTSVAVDAALATHQNNEKKLVATRVDTLEGKKDIVLKIFNKNIFSRKEIFGK